MIFPNKFINFDSSILSKLHLIKEIEKKEILLNDLYKNLEKYFNSLDEFLYFIDILYLLDYLDVNIDTGMVIIC